MATENPYEPPRIVRESEVRVEIVPKHASPERTARLGIWGLAGIACSLGGLYFFHHPVDAGLPPDSHPSLDEMAMSQMHIALFIASAFCFFMLYTESPA